jgi:hypothetical protein
MLHCIFQRWAIWNITFNLEINYSICHHHLRTFENTKHSFIKQNISEYCLMPSHCVNIEVMRVAVSASEEQELYVIVLFCRLQIKIFAVDC